VSIFFRPHPMAGSRCATALLPEELWGAVLGFLPWSAHPRIRDVSRALSAVVGAHWAAVTDLRLGEDLGYFSQRGLLSFPNLRTLRLWDMTALAGPMLESFATLLPSTIQSLDLSSCVGASDEIEVFFEGPLATSLQYLDISFTRTTYAMVLRLYARFPDLVIRRIPEWMTGHWHCDFTASGAHHDDVQTYYAGGTFASPMYPRRGVVSSLIQDGDDVTYRLLSFLSARESFLTGFRVRPLASGFVLLGTMWSEDPPEAFPADAEATVAALSPGEEATVPTAKGPMPVWKVRITPLAQEELRPPPIVLTGIQGFFDRRNRLRSEDTGPLWPAWDFGTP